MAAKKPKHEVFELKEPHDGNVINVVEGAELYRDVVRSAVSLLCVAFKHPCHSLGAFAASGEVAGGSARTDCLASVTPRPFPCPWSFQHTLQITADEEKDLVAFVEQQCKLGARGKRAACALCAHT